MMIQLTTAKDTCKHMQASICYGSHNPAKVTPFITLADNEEF